MSELSAQDYRDAANRALKAGDQKAVEFFLGKEHEANAKAPMLPQLEAARTAAQRANDTAAVEHFEGMIEQARPQVPEGFFKNTQTGQMTNRELLTNKFKQEQGPATATGLGYLQGFTAGTSDEILGGIGRLTGSPQEGTYIREAMRAKQDAAVSEYPGTTIASELVGGVLGPLGKLVKPAKTIKSTAVTGAGVAGLEGFARGEGDASARSVNALRSAATGGLLSTTFAGATRVAPRAFEKAVPAEVRRHLPAGFGRTFAKTVERPTVANLKDVKTKAYSAVEDAGEKFSPDEMRDLFDRSLALLNDADFDDIADTGTASALRTLERRAGEEVTLGRLDKLRQSMWSRYERTDEPLILDLIGQIDDLVATRAETSELMKVARGANSRFKKAEMLDLAFRKARLQTAAVGSGGNLVNKYRQAIVSIVVDPRRAKWFDADEVALMEHFVEGTNAENALRGVSKMAPGGNGLMTALAAYGAMIDPATLGVGAVGGLAHAGAQKSAKRGSERLLDTVSGFARPEPPSTGEAGLLGGLLAGSLAQ